MQYIPRITIYIMQMAAMRKRAPPGGPFILSMDLGLTFGGQPGLSMRRIMVPTSVPLGSRFWKIREKLGPKMASHHTTPRVKSSNRRAAVLVWGRMAAQPNTTGDGDPFNAADSKSPLPSRQHGFVDKWEEGHLTRLRHEGSDPSCKIGTGGESGPPPLVQEGREHPRILTVARSG